LYRRFEETGKVLDFTLARERSGKVAREAIAAFLERRLVGEQLEPDFALAGVDHGSRIAGSREGLAERDAAQQEQADGKAGAAA
jgi:hypothetical protein